MGGLDKVECRVEMLEEDITQVQMHQEQDPWDLAICSPYYENLFVKETTTLLLQGWISKTRRLDE